MIALFAIIFNVVANDPFEANPMDPDDGAGMMFVSVLLLLAMSYAPLIFVAGGKSVIGDSEKPKSVTALIAFSYLGAFIYLGVLVSITHFFGFGAMIVFFFFSVLSAKIIASSKEIREMLLKPFEEDTEEEK